MLFSITHHRCSRVALSAQTCSAPAPILQSLCSPVATGIHLDELYSDLGMADETPDDVMHSVCDPQLPDAGEVWGGVVEKSGEWLDLAREAM